MDAKVDRLRKERTSTTKQMKKLAKRISSVSMSRDSAPMTARNFGQPSNRKVMKNPEVTESQVNLVLSDSKSDQSRNKEKEAFNNSRYTKEYRQFEDEQEIAIDTSTEKMSFKNFTIGPSHASTIRHAVANLADNSDNYSEDMDESVAFSKGFSDKENYEVQKKLLEPPKKYIYAKKQKKPMKTNRSELNSKLNPLNYTTNPKRPKEFQVNHPDKRRGSYLN